MVIGADGLADVAVERIHDLEARWSRFIEDSDISRANAQAGSPTRVSAETITLCARADEAWEMTGGRFDPLLGIPLAQLGYDRSFESMAESSTTATIAPLVRDASARMAIDIDRDSVTVPAGLAFDPGGIGKGLAGDLVVTEVLAAGGRGVLVDLGGDIRVGGEGPDRRGWPIGIEDPRVDHDVLLHVLLADGAVASSSRRRRSWTAAHELRHHLLDPSDGHPVHNGVLGVSVLAHSGWEAEAFTKAAFVAGPEAMGLLDDLGVDGVLVLDDGTCCWTPGLDPTDR